MYDNSNENTTIHFSEFYKLIKENEIQAKTEEDCLPEPPKPIRAQLITESFSLKIEKSSSDEKEPDINDIVYTINVYDKFGFTPCYYKKGMKTAFNRGFVFKTRKEAMAKVRSLGW